MNTEQYKETEKKINKLSNNNLVMIGETKDGYIAYMKTLRVVRRVSKELPIAPNGKPITYKYSGKFKPLNA